MQELITFLSHHPALTGGVMLAFMLLILIEWLRAKRQTFSISTQEAVQKMNHDHAVVIDIRSKDLYQQSHPLDAIHLSSQDIQASTKKLDKWRTKPLILVCQTGTESHKLAANLRQQGYSVYALTGGLRAWMESKLPITKEST